MSAKAVTGRHTGWLVTFADLVTLLIAFVVSCLALQSNKVEKGGDGNALYRAGTALAPVIPQHSEPVLFIDASFSKGASDETVQEEVRKRLQQIVTLENYELSEVVIEGCSAAEGDERWLESVAEVVRLRRQLVDTLSADPGGRLVSRVLGKCLSFAAPAPAAEHVARIRMVLKRNDG